MIPKSIKWRLQFWYGLILMVVLAGFGVTAYQLERGRQLGRIDQELHRRIGVLANALHRPPRRGPQGGEQPFDRPPPGQFPGEGSPNDGSPPLQRNRPLPEFHLPSEATHLFDTSDPHAYYYKIISSTRQGESVIAQSTNQPAANITTYGRPDVLHSVNTFAPRFPDPAKPPKVISFENYRETEEWLPSGEMIRVGCSIAPELKELHRTAMNLTGIGGLILLVGLAGGGWLVSRAIKPIETISATAAKISAGDLSQRINVAEAESELGRLAAVLNSTFARLDAAFAQQKQFASDAAHELRTPVSVMLTQTQTALNRERSAPEYRETLEACQRAALRMRRLIGSLLELARLDAGQEQMKRLEFDLAQTANDCRESIRPLADSRQVKIISELPSLKCTGDAERIAQVITNLLTNAIQYNRDGGEVRITLESRAGMAMLQITDTGSGISAEDLPRVFERFYRGDKSRTGAGNAGLGLAISKAIVEAHGGSIEVASEVKAGTTFTVRLPV